MMDAVWMSVLMFFSHLSTGDLCIKSHSETAETSSHPQGLPSCLTGRCSIIIMTDIISLYSFVVNSLLPSLLLFQLKDEEEEDEERKNSRVSQERQRTLDRLRTFKQVCALL